MTNIQSLKVRPRLQKILNERGITQLALSSMTGVPQNQISRWDKQESHKDSHVFKIARCLGLRVEDLFEIEYEDIKKDL